MKHLAGRIFDFLDRVRFLTLCELLEFRSQRLRILIYHRIADADTDTELEPGLISASPAEFAEQMHLLASNYNPVSLNDLIDAQAGRSTLPSKAVLVTFDDGYEDFAECAWPIMREHNIPATLFVPTAFPAGQPLGFWWDRLHYALMQSPLNEVHIEPFGKLTLGDAAQRRGVYKQLRNRVKMLPHKDAMDWLENTINLLGEVPALNRVLTWQALQSLAEEGVSICSHGESHALMTRLSTPELEDDLQTSLHCIEHKLAHAAGPRVVAYPANAFDEKVASLASRAGYLLGFGGQRGINRIPSNHPMNLQRLPVLKYSRGLFRAQLRPTVCWLSGYVLQLRERLKA
jgi:peptidoglycan/xylan/chitin deacetylase (PgdA/CDA1 family)